MPQFVVMFPADDPVAWSSASEAERQLVYDVDAAFVTALRAAGGSVRGGAEIAAPEHSRTLRRTSDGVEVVAGRHGTDAGALSGLLLVEAPEEQALLALAGTLLEAHPVVEVHAVVAD